MTLDNQIFIMLEEQAYYKLYCRDKVMAVWIVKKIICHFPSLCLFMLAGLVSHSFPTEGLGIIENSFSIWYFLVTLITLIEIPSVSI